MDETEDHRVAAFRRLADERLDWCYRLATAIVGDGTQSQDAVHDAVVLAWERWPSLRDQARFDAWFSRIVVNVCRDRLRRRARHPIADLATQVVAATPDPAPDIERRVLLAHAFDRLKPDDVVVLGLAPLRRSRAFGHRVAAGHPASDRQQPTPLREGSPSLLPRGIAARPGVPMNEHELDQDLADFGAGRVQPTAPRALRRRIATMPLASKSVRGGITRTGWRNVTMFGTLKFVMAAAVVALFGGALVAGGWLQQPDLDSDPAAVASASVTTDSSSTTPVGPVEVSAQWADGDRIRSADVWSANGVKYQANSAERLTTRQRATDSRLVGRVTMAVNSSDYRELGGPEMRNFAFRIETADGAWQMRPATAFVDASGTQAPVVGIFDGEDAYAGLTAVLRLRFADATGIWNVQGYVLDVPLPSDPLPAVGQ